MCRLQDEVLHEGHAQIYMPQCRGCGLVRRREDDGTFVVLMQSVEHPDAPLREAPFYNWRAPIRAQVSSTLQACFSHAALQELCAYPKGTKGGT